MPKLVSRLATTTFIFSSLTLFGCSSSDDGATAPVVPANAITITSTNSKQVVSDAIVGGNAVDSLPDLLPISVDIDNKGPAVTDVLERAIDKAKHWNDTAILSTTTGIAIDEACTDGGTITGDITETDTSASGTITFNECIESGITINGIISFSASIDAASNWTLTITGNLSGSDSDKTVSLNGLTYNETGNDLDLSYSINTYTYTADIPNGGFVVQLMAPITGNESATCPTSGIMLVTGADNTQAKATINSDNTVTIENNDGSGTFTPVTTPAPGSPYPCTDFFV